SAMLANTANLWFINIDLFAANGHWDRTNMSPRNEIVPLAESQLHVIDPTNPCRALNDGVKHRLHVRRRAANDAEYLGCCRLVLQGLPQLRVARFEFLEQS